MCAWPGFFVSLSLSFLLCKLGATLPCRVIAIAAMTVSCPAPRDLYLIC